MSIGRLIVEFEARTGKFETDTGRAAKIMEKRAREIDAKVRKIGIAVGAAIGTAVVGIGALVKKSIDAADEMDKLAQKTGLTIEAVSQLQYAAKLSGVEDLGASLTKFNKSVGEAAQGTKNQAEAFKTLGVEIRNADGTLKDTETLFNETAEAISKLPDGIKKTQLAIDLFGKSGAQLIPFLNEGKAGLAAMRAEADALGLTLDERTGKAADGFNDNLDRLQAVVSGIGTRLAVELAPELERLTGLFVQTAKESDTVSESADGVAAAFKGVALVAITLGNIVTGLTKAFVQAHLAQAAFFSGNFSQAYDELAIGSKAILDDINDVKQAYESLFGNAPSLPSRPKPRSGGDRITDEEAAKAAQKAADEAAKQAERQAKAIQDSIAALNEESAAYGLSREQLEARKLSQMGATDEQVRQAYEITKYIGLQEAAAKADEERARIFEQTRTPAEEYAATIEYLNALFNYGKSDIETYTRAVEQAADKMDAALNKNKKTVKTWEDELKGAAERAGASIQSALSDFLFNPFEGGLKGMVKNFAQTLQRMAADLAASQILRKLGEMANNSGSSGGGFWASAVGMIGSLFGGAKAMGGPVAAGMPYLVGERGPELMVPKTAGTIVPNDKMMGGTTINNYWKIDAPRGTVSESTMNQVATRIGQSTAKAVRKYS